MALSSSADKLAGVDPDVAARARFLVQWFQQQGWPLVVTSGRRSVEHQQALIKAGLTKARHSRHLTGQAFDVSFTGFSREEALRLPRWVWEHVGKAGESMGLRWGGRFADFDPFHFDLG